MSAPPPPPPPPPHGNRPNNSGAGGLPPGNYDIFVIPPHSSGSGFLYLPSLQPHRNSFLAGVVCTLVVVGLWAIVVPVVRQWTSSMMSSGGPGMLLVIFGMGVIGWAFGKTQVETATSSSGPQPAPGPEPSGGAYTSGNSYGAQSGWQHQQQQRQQQHAGPNPSSSANWEKAREEMRKREEERKKKEEAEKKAEKERWEKSRQREKEAREKEAREKEVRAREQREKEFREKAQQERLKKEREAKEKANGNYQKPTAHSYAASEDAYSYRPYDQPKQPNKMASNSSFLSESTTSYTGTHSTARTTPPPSHRGPYVNKDPDKVTIRAVYALTDMFPKPVAQLVTGQNNVTEGLVLKMTTEGLFIDDDVRGVPQREWDVKAWTMKLVESGELRGRHILRASVRDAENKKYIFIIDESEAWKVAVGLQRLRRGSQVRSLGVSGLSVNEMNNILKTLGW